MTTFYRVIRIIATLPIRSFFRMRYKDMDKLPKEGGLIICANHISFLDAFFLSVALRRQVFYMGKDELFRIPVLRAIIKGVGAFPVKRGAADRSSLERASEIIREGKILGLFPEGTRSKTGELQRFKSGAAMLAGKLRADIVPVSISCSKNRVRPFKRIYVTMGDVIPYQALGLEKGTASELRAASALIMEKVRELMPENM